MSEEIKDDIKDGTEEEKKTEVDLVSIVADEANNNVADVTNNSEIDDNKDGAMDEAVENTEAIEISDSIETTKNIEAAYIIENTGVTESTVTKEPKKATKKKKKEIKQKSKAEIADKRRKRVDRIKRDLIIAFLIFLITPSIICIVALTKVNRLNAQIDELSDKLNKVELTYLLKNEAEDGLEELNVQAAESSDDTAEQTILHYEYYADDYSIPEHFKQVFLTFDDGPSIYTNEILDILDRYGVKATFFVTGAQANAHPEWYQEIVSRGHTIGMHSFSHVYNSIYASEESFVEDFDRIHDFILGTTGVDSKYYRFPGGSSNTVSEGTMEDYCRLVLDRGCTYYDWNVSSMDAANPSLRSSEIANNVLSNIGKYNHSMVLMHDSADKYSTVQALPIIIENILAMDDTVMLPISDGSMAIQHLMIADNADESQEPDTDNTAEDN